MLGRRLINTGAVACTTDTVQILDADTTQSLALYRFEDNANDTASSTGKFGKGAIFTSALTTRVDLSSNAAFAKSNDFSLSMWFYIDTMASGDNQTILAFNTIGTPRYFIMFNNGNIGNIRFYGGGSTNRYSANNLFSAGSWYHLAVSKSSTAGLVVYLNGTAVITQTGETAAYTNGGQANSKNCIGAYYVTNSHLYPFKGKIDQFRVFNKPITQAEVNTLYAETSSTVNTLQILGDTSCIATYTFEGNADDLSNNYDGVATSDVAYDYNGTEYNITYAAGKFDKAAVFNGTNSYITAGNPNAAGGARSFSAWIKTTSTSFQSIITNGGASHASGLNMFVYNNKLFSTSGNGSSAENYGPTSSANINTGAWVHCVLTMSGTAIGSILKTYVNGVLDGTHTTTVLITDTYNTFRIGGRTLSGSNTQFFNGEIDQVRIFAKELSSGEVNSLYNETTTTAALATINNPSTVAYYKMADATDETGSYNGTASNVDFNVAGKYGFAGKFSGSSGSYMQTGYTAILGTSASISLWVNIDAYTSYGGFAIDSTGTGAQARFTLGQGNTAGKLWVSVGNGSTSWYDETTVSISSYGLNNWFHLVGTVNGTSVKIYINGSLIHTLTSSVSYVGGGQHPYYFGGWGNSLHLNGKLDQIRFFNKEISATEVTKLYNEVQCANTIDTPESYFNTVTYNNPSTSQAYAVGFAPDFVWFKQRTGSNSHQLYDTIRTDHKALFSNTNDAEYDYSSHPSGDLAPTITSTGFTTPAVVNNGINNSSNNYVAWAWKAGGTAVSGTGNHYINVQKSVADEAGFSIVRFDFPFTPGGNALVPNDASYNHGLSKKPDLIITKAYSGYLGAANWYTWASPLGAGSNGLTLDSHAQTGSGYFGTIDSTKAEFRFSSNNINGLSGVVTYNFRNIDGYQRIGSYVGNGSTNGPFVYTGFEPAWLIVKRTDAGGNSWAIFDNKRVESDGDQSVLFADTSSTESDYDIDFATNGFIIKTTTTNVNANGGSYIFMAIAANPDTTAPTKANSFNTVIYPGDGDTSREITGVGFKPDFTWIKQRNADDNHALFDSVRGVNLSLSSNITNATNNRNNYSTKGVTSFDADGFTLGSWDNVNGSNDTYVAWNWKGLDHDRNLPAINNHGSIPSSVSANIAAGFSAVSYKGNASSGATVGHGLGEELDFLIVKPTNLSTQAWSVYVKGVTDTNAKYFRLNESNGIYTTSNPRFIVGNFNDNVFSLGSDNATNGNNDEYIAYCFRSITGYSKVGTYTGQTSGVTITTDFRPSFILVKSSNNTEHWSILDTVRGTGKSLNPNRDNLESDSTLNTFTVSDTGFSFPHQSTADAMLNENGYEYIYLAIA